jgi:hypothetical protein
VLLPMLLAAVAIAAPKPDLTGEWRLVIAGSDFAKQPPPRFKVVQIDHLEPALRMTIVENAGHGDIDGTAFYSTDGVERVNPVMGNPLKAVTRWDGAVLEMRTSGAFGPNQIELLDRYELSGGGKTLTLHRHFEGKGPNGPMETQDQKLMHELVPLRAGVAKVEITPGALLPMYGYASRKCGPANGVHDPLMAKALVLESALTRLAIVTLDLGSIAASQRLHRDVAEKLRIPTLLLAASHTHSAPSFLGPDGKVTQQAYFDELEAKIFSAVRSAAENLFEATLRTGTGSVQLGYNRLLRR